MIDKTVNFKIFDEKYQNDAYIAICLFPNPV